MIILNKIQIEWLEAFWIHNLTFEEKKQYIYSKGLYDKEFFWNVFLPHWKTVKWPILHDEIYKALWWKVNTCVICPRWHWKTTTLLIDIIHSLVYTIYGSQLYIASAWLWAESLWKIKYELETNQLIHEVFWNLVPKKATIEEDKITWTKKWREKLLELTNWESIETLTKWNPVRWKRPKRIIVDDLDENKDVMNPKMVEKTRIWFFTSLYNTLLPWGKIVILWTIVGNMCMVKYIKDTKNWNVIEYQAINNGKALWPELWSLDELEKRKAEIGSTLFNQEFMNIPLQSENTVIKEEHIQYFDYTWELFDAVIIWVDPAISEKTNSDDFAIVVTGHRWANKYVIEAKALRWKDKDPFKATLSVKHLYEKYSANKVVVETIAFQQVMSKLFKWQAMATTEINSSRDKVTRLMEHQWDFEQWQVFFNRAWTRELVEQLLMFPDVEHDDLVDAMVYSFKHKKRSLHFDTL